MKKTIVILLLFVLSCPIIFADIDNTNITVIDTDLTKNITSIKIVNYITAPANFIVYVENDKSDFSVFSSIDLNGFSDEKKIKIPKNIYKNFGYYCSLPQNDFKINYMRKNNLLVIKLFNVDADITQEQFPINGNAYVFKETSSEDYFVFINNSTEILNFMLSYYNNESFSWTPIANIINLVPGENRKINTIIDTMIEDYDFFSLEETNGYEFKLQIFEKHDDMFINIVSSVKGLDNKSVNNQNKNEIIVADTHSFEFKHEIKNVNNDFVQAKIWVIDTGNRLAQNESGFGQMMFGAIKNGFMEIQYSDKEDGIIMGRGSDGNLSPLGFSFKIIFLDEKNVSIEFYDFTRGTGNYKTNNIDRDFFSELAQSLFTNLER